MIRMSTILTGIQLPSQTESSQNTDDWDWQAPEGYGDGGVVEPMSIEGDSALSRSEIDGDEEKENEEVNLGADGLEKRSVG